MIFLIGLVVSIVVACIAWKMSRAIFLKKRREKHYTFDEISDNAFAIGFLTLFLMAILTMLAPFIIMNESTTELDKTVTKSTYAPIVALSLGKNTTGNFFLGCGQINGETYYYYYTDQDNKYELNKLPAEKTAIVEDNKPRVEDKITTPMYKEVPGKFEEFLDFLGIHKSNTDWQEDDRIFSSNPERKTEEYILHIQKEA